MDPESPQHAELTLMFTDIVGYSRLMGRDEASTIEMLGDYRKILLAHIEEHGGLFIEFAGDAIFARFDTALAATIAAVAIQKHLRLFNQGRDKDLPPLRTRIGLHKGKVIVRDNAVLGDDVNIAARLEPLAVADGICISKAVYDDIKLYLREPIKPLGLQSLKNIQQKIRAYLIKPTGIGWRDHFHYFWLSCEKKISAYRYPISAVILILITAGFYFIPRWLVPGYAANYVEIANFQNLMNADGKSDYFSAGITEAVRSQLADMRDVYIVDADKGIHAPIRLEGSVQKIGANLRISYRIVRRKGDVQIGGGKLDGTHQDIFILQDRLVGDIARNLASEFKLQNFRPAPLKLTNNITAYDYYLQGADYLSKPRSQEDTDKAIQNFNTALVHDPAFPLANTGLCSAYWKKYEIAKSARWLNEAERHCLLALEQDESSAATYNEIGAIYRDTGKYDKAVQYLEKGLAIDKNSVSTAIVLASIYDLMGRTQNAEALYLKTIRLAPMSWHVYDAYGYFLTRNGRYEHAIEVYKKILRFTPKNSMAFNNIGINYFYKNDFKNAAIAFESAAKIEPEGLIFANTGSMYYSSGEYEKSVEMYGQALRLDPENCQWMVYLAEAYKFLPGKKAMADEYFKKAIKYGREEVQVNPDIAKSYRCLAMSFLYFGERIKAIEMADISKKLEPEVAETHYLGLRIAILEKNEEKIREHAQHLLETEYSVKLLLSEPDFAILKEAKFNDLFTHHK